MIFKDEYGQLFSDNDEDVWGVGTKIKHYDSGDTGEIVKKEDKKVFIKWKDGGESIADGHWLSNECERLNTPLRRMTLKFLKEKYDDKKYGINNVTVIHCSHKCGGLVWVRNRSTRSSLCGTLWGHQLSMDNKEQVCNCTQWLDNDMIDVTSGPSTTFGYGAEVWIKKA